MFVSILKVTIILCPNEKLLKISTLYVIADYNYKCKKKYKSHVIHNLLGKILFVHSKGNNHRICIDIKKEEN